MLEILAVEIFKVATTRALRFFDTIFQTYERYGEHTTNFLLYCIDLQNTTFPVTFLRLEDCTSVPKKRTRCHRFNNNQSIISGGGKNQGILYFSTSNEKKKHRKNTFKMKIILLNLEFLRKWIRQLFFAECAKT